MSSLKDRIEGLRKSLAEASARAADAKALEELRTAFLGRKKGHITLLFEDLKSVPAEEKREAGRLINELKVLFEDRIAAVESRASGNRGRSGTAAASVRT